MALRVAKMILAVRNAAVATRNLTLATRNAALAVRNAAVASRNPALARRKMILATRNAAVATRKMGLAVANAALRTDKTPLQQIFPAQLPDPANVCRPIVTPAPDPGDRAGKTLRAVLLGMLVMLAGTLPRNLLFAANLRYFASVPWAVPLTAIYLWFFWRYLQGAGPPEWTAEERRASLRANRLPGRLWAWALLAGGFGIVALVLALQVANRMVLLPAQQLPDLAQVPRLTVLSLLLMAAPVAGIVEEAAFRGYMQGPIERCYGLAVAILISGTMFAVAHLDFTLILWPYYVAVAAIYGTVTYLTRSILPAVVLHTGGNLYSNFALWRHGQAEWQAAPGTAALIWQAGVDRSFWSASLALVFVTAAMVWAFLRLAGAASGRPLTIPADTAK